MIQSYKRKHELEKKYDTIVIGSGIGGLTVAALLAKEGEKVLVIRKTLYCGWIYACIH